MKFICLDKFSHKKHPLKTLKITGSNSGSVKIEFYPCEMKKCYIFKIFEGSVAALPSTNTTEASSNATPITVTICPSWSPLETRHLLDRSSGFTLPMGDASTRWGAALYLKIWKEYCTKLYGHKEMKVSHSWLDKQFPSWNLTTVAAKRRKCYFLYAFVCGISLCKSRL